MLHCRRHSILMGWVLGLAEQNTYIQFSRPHSPTEAARFAATMTSVDGTNRDGVCFRRSTVLTCPVLLGSFPNPRHRRRT